MDIESHQEQVTACCSRSYRIDNEGAKARHQVSCKECAEWLFYNDRGRFDKLLATGATSRNANKKTIVKIAVSKEIDLLDFQYLFPKTENQPVPLKTDIASELVRSCKAYELSNALYELPVTSGVYIVAIHSEKGINFAYIGSSKSIRDRFKTHHLREQFYTLLNAGVEMYVYCLLFPLQESEPAMRQTEDFLIKELKPRLNGRIPK